MKTQKPTDSQIIQTHLKALNLKLVEILQHKDYQKIPIATLEQLFFRQYLQPTILHLRKILKDNTILIATNDTFDNIRKTL